MKQIRTLPNNIIVDTDYYKITHHLAYKRGLTNLYSYGECRVGAEFDYVIFFGLQKYIIQTLLGNVVTDELIEEAERKNAAWSGFPEYFNKGMWIYIKEKYNGVLPIRIKAVPEGIRVPISIPLFTIEALDPICVPLVNHIETELSHIWYPTTIASNSFEIKKDLYKLLKENGTPEAIEFMCHDFGYRGCTCPQQAERGGMAHMINFRGSDTCRADRAIDFYYGTKEKAILQSVFATEHSTAQVFGAGSGEYDYINNILDKAPDGAIISAVVDTYNAMNFIENVITREDIKERILSRNGKFVGRHDSGQKEELTNRSLVSMAKNFGYSHNKNHYQILNPKTGLLWGDDMRRKSINGLHNSINVNKWSSDNLVVGSGGGLLQEDKNRDTLKFAIKASFGKVDEKEINLIKNPVTQPNKKSKTGRLKVHEANGKFMTISSANETPQMFNSYIDTMETVFEMGELVKEQTFDEIRKRTQDAFEASIKEDEMMTQTV